MGGEVLVQWGKWVLTVVLGLCIVFSLCAGPVTASIPIGEDFWGTAFDRHGSIMFLIEVESGKIIAANQAAAGFYGYTVEELENMNIEQIHMYSPNEVALERLAAASEERNYFIFPHRLANGEVRTVEVSSYPIDEEQTLLFSVINDITAREAAKLELLEKNDRLRRAEMITGLGSWEFRLSDDRLFLSAGAEEILGLVSGDPMPNLHEITVPEYREVREKALRELVENNTPYDVELKFMRPEDGTIIDIHSIGEYDPETNSVFGTLLDITDRKASELALAASRRRSLYLFLVFLSVQLIVIIVLIVNILQRRKAQQEMRQNLDRNESLVRILQHPTTSVQELLDYALSESIRLSASSIGYIYLYSEETKEFTLNTWSHHVMQECRIVDRKTVYQLDQTGVWGEAVRQRKSIIVNDFGQANLFKKGYPSGHARLTKFMTLPIFDQGQIVAVIGLANKETDYDDMDIWQITLLMNGVWASLERKKSQIALTEEKERLKTTLLSVGDGVIATDQDGRVKMINEVAQTLTGWSQEEAVGQPFDQVFNIINEYTREPCEDPIKQVLASGNPIGLANHTVLLSKRGDEKPIADSAAPIRGNGGEITGAILVFRDVSDERQRLEKIEYLSYHDQLTGLHNRRFFEDKLRDLDRAKNLPLSIIMADLNNLKLVNDTFGHAVGDRFLKRTAQVFKAVCRPHDIIARWGGDEFIILLPKTTSKEVALMASRIDRALQKEKIESLSISVALGWVTKNYANEDISVVFKSVENHMYRSKLFQNKEIQSETIQALMIALYEKNEREEQHSKRVSALCHYVGRELGLTNQEVKELEIVGLFHDIGKIAIEEYILNKTGALTEDEWKEIMRHPEVGYRLLGAVKDMTDIASYVLSHHERWDGLGYPKGTKAEDIPLQSRIVAVVDAYDAMVSERPYKKSLTKQQAMDELRKNAGTQFDPNIVDACIEAISRWDGEAASS